MGLFSRIQNEKVEAVLLFMKEHMGELPVSAIPGVARLVVNIFRSNLKDFSGCSLPCS